MTTKKDLTPKQKRFCEEYIRDLNATKAAIAAGYSAKTAGQIGERLLKKVEIADAIEAAMKARSERTLITADRVIRELARVAFLDIRKALNPDGSLRPLDQLDDDSAAAIAGIEVNELRGPDGDVIGYAKKIRIADKLRALELLGKHLGMFEAKIKVSGDESNPLVLLIKQIQGSAFNPVQLRAVNQFDDEQVSKH